MGKERKIVDIPTDHPTCSRQHAVIQFRNVTVTDGDSTLKMNKYVIALPSIRSHYLGLISWIWNRRMAHFWMDQKWKLFATSNCLSKMSWSLERAHASMSCCIQSLISMRWWTCLLEFDISEFADYASVIVLAWDHWVRLISIRT